MKGNTLLLFSGFILLLGCKTPTTSPENTFKDQHRPQFHFTPPEMWMNDPNGMVYYDGEYHLFYQHYPEQTVWGPMHWGHAVSEDLVNWEHLPIALYPDSLGYIFSGSAVVDWTNTSGFGTDGKSPLVAIFTYHDPVGEKAGTNTFQYQGIAYSNDRGRTWVKYEKNPVVPNPGIRDFRDPKVIWDKDSKQWIMVFAAWDHVKFYGSPNLKDWTYLSDFGREWGTHAGVWECPDIFPMKIEGSDEQRWVLLQSLNPGSVNGGSGTQYFVGDFDGKNFTVDKDFTRNFGKTPAFVPEGEIFEDFEDGYSKWQVEGEAFGNSPASGKIGDQQPVNGYLGNGLVNSFMNGDATTGKLTSESFAIQSPFINFLVGGGNDKLRTAIHLIVEGEKTRSSAGSNGEKLNWTGWDVSDLQGKTAHIEIIDTHTGGWGHINVDQIMFADAMATPEKDKAVWLDYGRDNYAGVTWSDVPDSDGRRIFIGWMSNWDYAQVVPTEKWRSAMTLARTLTLHQTPIGLRLLSNPVKELEILREESYKIQIEGESEQGVDLLGGKDGPMLAEVLLDFSIQKDHNSKVVIELSNDKGEKYLVGYDAESNSFFSDRTSSGKVDFSNVFAASIHKAPRLSNEESIKLHLFLDIASAELFADDGLTTITDIFFPSSDFNNLKLRTEGKGVVINEAMVYRLSPGIVN